VGSSLEAVHLDGGFVQSFFDKECGNLGALVSLKLDNLTHLVVVDKSAVAGEFLLECFQEFLGVILFWQALESGQSLTPITLLDTDMNIFGCGSNVCTVSERVPFVCKGIVGIEVLYAHAMNRKVTEWWFVGNEDEGERQE